MGRDLSSEWAHIRDEIHVWHASLDRDEAAIAMFEATLSPDEKARAHRFRFPKDTNHYIVGRGLLRELLGGYLGGLPAALQFCYGEYGKPFLSAASESSGLSFNLSHSAGLAVYAIARERNLGIDVERIKPDFGGEDIARRYFSQREVDHLLSLPVEQRAEAFFRCWTSKEAYLKARGAGLQIPLASFSVSLRPGQPAEFLDGVDPRWQVTSFTPAEGYAAAVVFDSASSPVRFFGPR